ncbi:DUF6735 family protein [Halomicrococcus gelatinilyticus]|uniref:DUF6735 family protein n=1 Tax=Halomicrococcus gelatinilyticus TaxID=1702103 RepID=UPI002E12CE51
MGHRALVAYERPDGRYDVHYAHWGAAGLALQREITPATPFADRQRNGWTPRVDPTPRARAVAFDDLPDHVDVREFEALYVVTLAWVVTAYLPLWFGPTLDSDVDAGALVAVDSPADARRVRRWFRATRAVVHDVVARGALSEREAVVCLAARVTEWTGDRREVIPVG